MKKGIYKICPACKNSFYLSLGEIRIKCCSIKCRGIMSRGRASPNKGKKGQIPWNKGIPSPFKGIPRNPEIGKKISMSKIGKNRPPFSDEWKKNIGLGSKGEKNGRWISDRRMLKKSDSRNGYAYSVWRKQVWLRDVYKCKIANPDCKGRIEAHHILAWRDYPELRYQVNNGITLCHAHHPRKRAEEKRLIPEFQALVSVSK